MSDRLGLADGSEMIVRAAGVGDAEDIAAVHPLPHVCDAPEEVYRNYYLAKTLTYIRAPSAGIIAGWVDDHLAGFVFHCSGLHDLRRFARSPSMVCWTLGQALSGRFGYSPSFWLNAVRWAVQHFRQPREYDDPSRNHEAVPDEIDGWIGTVHTVEEFRRLGVATELLSSAEERLSGNGAEEAALWVATDNIPGQNLYEKAGYVKAGQFSRVGEDCWLMLKRLGRGASNSTGLRVEETAVDDQTS